jgi:putative FmdB family regulatory protein
MPIYEYTCSKCKKRIEVIQKMSDEPLKTHKGCGGKLTKEISAAGFQFKGTGWYVTDYAKKAEPQKEAKAESGDGKPETKKAETTPSSGESSTEKKADKPAKAAKPRKS